MRRHAVERLVAAVVAALQLDEETAAAVVIADATALSLEETAMGDAMAMAAAAFRDDAERPITVQDD